MTQTGLNKNGSERKTLIQSLMIQGTRSGERQRRAFKALSIKALIDQHTRKGRNLCMAVTSHIYGKQQEISLEK